MTPPICNDFGDRRDFYETPYHYQCYTSYIVYDHRQLNVNFLNIDISDYRVTYRRKHIQCRIGLAEKTEYADTSLLGAEDTFYIRTNVFSGRDRACNRLMTILNDYDSP